LSAEVESVALQPKAPFIGAVGQFETDEQKWGNCNSANYGFMQYDVVEGAPPPQRQQPPQFPAALRETRMAAIEAIKATMGLYDASLGARSNETSGIAIQERAQQGDMATYHYIDNMSRAIRYAGTVIIDLLPKVYDTPRVVRILQPDGEAEAAAINTTLHPETLEQVQPVYMDRGRYDVVVKAGPSFETQRQETAKALSELIRAYPALAEKAGDILFKNMDFPGADEVAERLKPQGGLPPQVQQQMQQMQEAIQQLHQQNAEKDQALNEGKLREMGLQVQLKDKGAANDTNESKMYFEAIIQLLQMNQSAQQNAQSLAVQQATAEAGQIKQGAAEVTAQ
jgi:hypothetical protein